MNERFNSKAIVKKNAKLEEIKKAKQNKLKNRKSSDTLIQLSDPFGFVSKRHFALPDA